jgi:hypothetical protein
MRRAPIGTLVVISSPGNRSTRLTDGVASPRSAAPGASPSRVVASGPPVQTGTPPVPRNVASATYGFVRFIGGGLAPLAAGLLAERLNVRVPFLLGAVVVLAGAVLLQTVRADLDRADAPAAGPSPAPKRKAGEEAVTQV